MGCVFMFCFDVGYTLFPPWDFIIIIIISSSSSSSISIIMWDW